MGRTYLGTWLLLLPTGPRLGPRSPERPLPRTVLPPGRCPPWPFHPGRPSRAASLSNQRSSVLNLACFHTDSASGVHSGQCGDPIAVTCHVFRAGDPQFSSSTGPHGQTSGRMWLQVGAVPVSLALQRVSPVPGTYVCVCTCVFLCVHTCVLSCVCTRVWRVRVYTCMVCVILYVHVGA